MRDMIERAVFDREADMTAGAVDVRPLVADDGKSGASLQSLRIDGRPFVLKRTTLDDDWTMRLMGDSIFRPRLVWERGIMDRAPVCIDHATEAMAVEDTPDGPRLSILMHDVGDRIVPEGERVVPLDQHRCFVDDMAALAAEFWGFADGDDLTTVSQRLRFLSLDHVESERSRADTSPMILMVEKGWATLPERAPSLATTVLPLQADPRALVDAFETTPSTFIHGDWKMGNLGRHADGRTILLDWAFPGRGPAALELAWYLALNAERLPESKEATIERFRAALESLGVDTTDWWDRQMGLSAIAIMVMFGWEKALGSETELAWWDERVALERRWLG